MSLLNVWIEYRERETAQETKKENIMDLLFFKKTWGGNVVQSLNEYIASFRPTKLSKHAASLSHSK